AHSQTRSEPPSRPRSQRWCRPTAPGTEAWTFRRSRWAFGRGRPNVVGDKDHVSFDQFGRNFMREVVTADRVAATIASVVGERIEVGPMAAGPRDAASATLRGRLVDVDVSPAGDEDGEVMRFTAVVRIECTLSVKAPVLNKRYRGMLTIPLVLDVRTAPPLRLVIEVDPPSAPDIGVELEAKDRSG